MIPSEHLQESVSAVAGALVSTTALYPLEIIKLHLVSEVRAGGDASSLKILLQLLKEDGFGALYQGLLSKCAHTTVQTFGYFYAYSCIKSFFANDEADMGAAGSLVSGYLAAVANLGVNMPLEVVSLRLQLQRGDRLSLLEALRTIFQKEGIPGFYRGITTNVLLCVNPAINYAAFEQLKRMVLRYRRNGSSSLNAMEAFIIGLAAKTIATLVTYPLVRAKILQQKQEDESSSVRPLSSCSFLCLRFCRFQNLCFKC